VFGERVFDVDWTFRVIDLVLHAALAMQIATMPLPGEYIYRCDVEQLLPVHNIGEQKRVILQNDGDKWYFDDSFAELVGVAQADSLMRDDETMLIGTTSEKEGAQFVAYLDPVVEKDDVYILDWKVSVPAMSEQDAVLLRSGLAICNFEMFGASQDNMK
jgi:hypothetical protein